MILNIKAETEYKEGYYNVTHTVTENETGNEIAVATNYVNDYFKLHFNGKTYEFRNHPKFVKRSLVKFKYPFSTKWKRTIGFGIHCDGKDIGDFYGDAMRCKEKGAKKNIGVTVFQHDSKAYLLFKVGLKGHDSHYYCIYNEHGDLIAIIARHSKGDYRATLYIENEDDLLITLFAYTEEIVCVGQKTDPSAGGYISVMKEEVELFDDGFINKVKEKEIE